MARFGHDAESREGGGAWNIAVMGHDEEGKWRFLLLAGPNGGWASFAILQNRKGRYYWEWQHHELGYTTLQEPRQSFQTRALCIENMGEMMHSCRCFGGLVEDMQRWG